MRPGQEVAEWGGQWSPVWLDADETQGAGAGHETIKAIADSTRDPAGRCEPSPGPGQTGHDSQHGVGLRVRVLVCDHDDGVVAVRRKVPLPEQCLSGDRLHRGKAKDRVAVGPENEPHPGRTQVADTVEQHDRRGVG